MNIVIPFRNTCGTSELDMCIKLILKNLKVKYDSIYVVGDEYANPQCRNILVGEQKYNKWLDSNFLVKKYIEMIHKPFILFNDDFFLTDVVDDIPCYYFSTLKDRLLTTYVINDKINKLRLSSYGLNIRTFLDKVGNYENYEVHIPMIVEYPSVMNDAIVLCNEADFPALKRTMYMKLCEERDYFTVSKELPHDVKFNEPLKVMQFPFFSLTERNEFEVFKDALNTIGA